MKQNGDVFLCCVFSIRTNSESRDKYEELINDDEKLEERVMDVVSVPFIIIMYYSYRVTMFI